MFYVHVSRRGDGDAWFPGSGAKKRLEKRKKTVKLFSPEGEPNRSLLYSSVRPAEAHLIPTLAPVSFVGTLPRQ